MPAIRTHALVKRYKNIVAVDHLDLEVRQGELFALLGVNGAGKTTTIKMLTGLTTPTAGDATVGGYSIIKESEQVKHLIGVSPQETAVAPNLTVRENLELICGIHGFSKAKTAEKISELSGQFDLDIMASGGISTLDDVKALADMNLYGAILGKALYTGAIDLAEAVKIVKGAEII